MFGSKYQHENLERSSPPIIGRVIFANAVCVPAPTATWKRVGGVVESQEELEKLDATNAKCRYPELEKNLVDCPMLLGSI